MSSHKKQVTSGSKQSYIFEIIFALIVLIDLWCIAYKPGLRLIVKPLIIASLLIYYVNSVREKQKTILLIALLFALLGDIFLLFDYPLFFKLGIASFLIMQLCYATYFKRFYENNHKLRWLSYAFIVLAMSFNIFFWGKFDDLKIPVAVYSMAIAYMIYFGVNQKIGVNLAIGVILFGISDFILALDKFVIHHIALSLLVMSTYAVAQYLIVKELISFTSVPIVKNK